MSKFRKGVSGNPRGRPKGSKNLTTLIMDAARDQVSVVIDGQPRKVSNLQATVAQLASKQRVATKKPWSSFSTGLPRSRVASRQVNIRSASRTLTSYGQPMNE